MRIEIRLASSLDYEPSAEVCSGGHPGRFGEVRFESADPRTADRTVERPNGRNGPASENKGGGNCDG
jgi:hypothetical protein